MIPGGSSVGEKSPVISGIGRINPLTTRVIAVIAYLLSGMIHQVLIASHKEQSHRKSSHGRQLVRMA